MTERMAGDAADPESASEGARYEYKPSLMSPPWAFELRTEGLSWRSGAHAGVLPYERITRVRLSFRPVSMQTTRYITEIRSHDLPKITVASTTWRSMVDQPRQDEAYAAFVAGLHRKLAAVRSTAAFVTGLPAAVFALGVVVFGGTLIGLAVLALRAVQRGEGGPAAAVAAFAALFAWQVGRHLYRNRPDRYRPDALPAATLPRPRRWF